MFKIGDLVYEKDDINNVFKISQSYTDCGLYYGNNGKKYFSSEIVKINNPDTKFNAGDLVYVRQAKCGVYYNTCYLSKNIKDKACDNIFKIEYSPRKDVYKLQGLDKFIGASLLERVV